VSLVHAGLREEYWLFLGGVYASAIIAKYSATSQSQGSDKTHANIGDENVSQLITNDAGRTDLGDFQYVLFNGIALVYYFGTFIPHLWYGMPHMPPVLTGLALTSAGGYSAKKLFLQQASPTLNSVVPDTVALPAAGAAAPTVEIWGDSLILPADVTPTGSVAPPTVTIGGKSAKVVSTEQTLGADHLTVEVPAGLFAGQVAKVKVVRADGRAATTAGGADALALHVS
jgi:hypothetical protein